MRAYGVRHIALGLACILTLAAVTGAVSAQTMVTVAGSLASVTPTSATITTASGTTTVVITDKTRVIRRLPAKLADIKAGSFLAVTSSKGPNGSLTAISINILDAIPTTRHVNYTMDSGNQMTNADVASVVTAASGRTLKMTYQGQTITILVPDKTPVRRILPAKVADLKVGQHITVRGSSYGGITATYISIE
jgi:hypothetical protein